MFYHDDEMKKGKGENQCPIFFNPLYIVSGKKIWEDEENKNNSRPEKLKVYLLSRIGEDDFERVKDSEGNDVFVETSASGDWKYFFPNLPLYKEAGDNTDDRQDGESGQPAEEAGTGEDEQSTENGGAGEEDQSPGDGGTEGDGQAAGDDQTEKQKIEYMVEEEPVEGYELAEGSGTEENGYDLVNLYEPDLISVEVEKIWEDNDNEADTRPESITIRLLADNEEIDSKTVTVEDEWKCSFADLPKTKDGREIRYTITEDNVAGYTSKVTEKEEEESGTAGDAGKGFTITNTHTPEKITIEGEKTWEDEENRDGSRPDSITIRLKADGRECAVKTVTGDDDWAWSFEDLPKYSQGKEITYSITEDNVKDYTSEIEGYNATNTYIPGRTKVSVTKVWDDADNRDGIRPASVQIKLLVDGEDTHKLLILQESNGWKADFTDLPADNADGSPITYTIEERTVGVITGTDGKGTYAVNITGTAEQGFTVTNTHTPKARTINIDVTKVWNDGDNTDGIRPKEVVIYLITEEEGVVRTATISEECGWKYTFTGLDEINDETGSPIVYTVEEETTSVITGWDSRGTYAAEVSGDSGSGFTITNTHTPVPPEPEEAQITVYKEWDETNMPTPSPKPTPTLIPMPSDKTEAEKGDDGQLPEEGESELQEEENELQEESGGGTALTSEGDSGGTEDTDEFEWPKRPESVTVHVQSGSETVDTAELSEANEWQHTFTGLPTSICSGNRKPLLQLFQPLYSRMC